MRKLISLILGFFAVTLQPVYSQAKIKPEPVITSSKVETEFITHTSFDWLATSLVLMKTEKGKLVPSNSRIDDSDFPEIIARFVWVSIGHTLPDDARTRTIARANSNVPDKVMMIGDMAPVKRFLCILISKKNDSLMIGTDIESTQKQLQSQKMQIDQMRAELDDLKIKFGIQKQ